MTFATVLMRGKFAGESGVALPEIMFWRQAIMVPILLIHLWWIGGLHRCARQ